MEKGEKKGRGGKEKGERWEYHGSQT